MLGLGLVEVSPHAQGTPPTSFSISNGCVAGQSDATSSWSTEGIRKAWAYDAQAGSYRLVRWIRSDKRPSRQCLIS